MKKTAEAKSKTYLSIGFLKKLDKTEPYMKELLISFVDEIQSKIIVNKDDFDDLRGIVRELAEAQKRTEIQMGGLTEAQKRTEIRMEELAEAQKRTEIRMEELTEAQKRTEIRMEELTEAQKRTEIRMEELAEAQKRTEIRMEELAEAQKNTEKEVRSLSLTVKEIKKQLGGLSMAVGYGIEDKIILYMYDFGKKEFDIDVKLVERKNLVYPDGNYDEINIYAEGIKKGQQAFIIGECKAQPGKKDFDKFNQVTERVKKIISGDILMFIAGYNFSPEVEAYAKKKYPDIKTYKTYEFELKSKGR